MLEPHFTLVDSGDRTGVHLLGPSHPEGTARPRTPSVNQAVQSSPDQGGQLEGLAGRGAVCPVRRRLWTNNPLTIKVSGPLAGVLLDSLKSVEAPVKVTRPFWRATFLLSLLLGLSLTFVCFNFYEVCRLGRAEAVSDHGQDGLQAQ